MKKSATKLLQQGLMKRIITAVFFLGLLMAVNPVEVFGQTAGQIYKPATGDGANILDPTGGINFHALPQIDIEPLGDLRTGPSGGHTDLVANSDGSESAAYMYYDAVNDAIIFRVRLGDQSTASKGYSFLFNTDFSLFGPKSSNFSSNNPGFQFEVVLESNNGIGIYKLDNTGSVASKRLEPVDTYFQKVISDERLGGGNGHFYDFYVPRDEIDGWEGISLTPGDGFRVAASTITRAQSGIEGTISDVNGINDGNYKSALSAFVNLVENSPEVTLNSLEDFSNIKPRTPSITGPLFAGNGQTVSGSSLENGATVKLFINDLEHSTTATVSGNSWSISNVNLSTNDKVYAIVTKDNVDSDSSTKLIVGTVTQCTEAPTTVARVGNNLEVTIDGIQGVTYTNGSNTNLTIRVYLPDGTLYTDTSGGGSETTSISAWDATTSTATLSGAGNPFNSLPTGYYVTAQLNGECESNGNATGLSQTVAPAISTNPILTSTTSISGTSVANAQVFLYQNGVQIGTTVTADGSGNWTVDVSGETLVENSFITAKAQSTGEIISDASEPVPVGTEIQQTTKPVITGNYVQQASATISGFIFESEGTTINVYVDDVLVGNTETDIYGEWSLAGVDLTGANTIKARATADGKTQSDWSETVNVSSVISGTPEIYGGVTEKTTTEGFDPTTGTVDGTTGTLNVYLLRGSDQSLLGTSTSFDVDINNAYSPTAGDELFASNVVVGAPDSSLSNFVLVKAPAGSNNIFLNSSSATSLSSGGGQTVSFEFKVLNSSYTTVDGATVDFSIVDGSGSLSATTGTTSGGGLVSVTYTTVQGDDDSTVKIRADVKDGSGNTDGSDYGSVKVEAEPSIAPGQVTLSTPADNATSISVTPQLSWQTATDASSYTVQVSTSSDFSTAAVNESNLTDLSYQLQASLLSETEYFWRVRATNNVGDGAWSATRSFTTEDNTAPTSVTLVSPSTATVRASSGSNNIKTLNVSYSYSEANPNGSAIVFDDGTNTATYNIDDSGYAGEGSAKTVSINLSSPDATTGNGFVDGNTYDIQITATDASSNSASDSGTDLLTIDNTAPSLASAIVDGAILTLTYNENLDESSTSAGSDFSVEGSTAGTLTPTGVNVSGTAVTLTLGTAIVFGETVTVDYVVPVSEAIQDDGAENDGAALTNQVVTNNTADATNPVVAITNPTDGDVVTAQNNIEGTSTDNDQIASIVLEIQRASNAEYWNDTSWQSGQTTVSSIASDGTFDSGNENWTYDSSGITGDDTYTVTATATDATGNSVNSSPASYTIDTTAPTGYTVAWDTDPINTGNESAAGFTITDGEVGATYEYTITSDGGAGSVTNTGTIGSASEARTGVNLSGLADGTLTVSVVLKDAQNNEGNPVTDTATKDTVSPTISNVSLTKDGSDNLVITFNSDESLGGANSDIVVSVDGPNNTDVYTFGGNDFSESGTGPFTYTLTATQSYNDGDGTYTASIDDAIDAAGNDGANGTDQDTYSLSSDNTAPSGYTVVWDTNPVNANNEGAAGFTISNGENGANYYWVITSSGGGIDVSGSGTLSGTTTASITNVDVSSLDDGTLTVTVDLTDDAGNQGSDVTDDATKDVNAPTISAINLGNDGSNNITVTFESDELLGTSTSDIAITVTGPSTFSQTFDRDDFTVSGTGPYVYTLDVDPAVAYGDDGIYTVTINDAIDVVGNDGADGSQTGTYNLNTDSSAPTITSATLAGDNTYIDIEFSEAVYTNNDETGAIQASDLNLTFNQNSGNATDVSINSLIKTSGDPLTGGETTIRVLLDRTGTPSGAETIEIIPADGSSIFDEAGNAMEATQTTGEETLSDQLSPTLANSTPSDDATGVVVGTNIELTFSETVSAGTGVLELYTTNGDALVESFDVVTDIGTDPGQINFNGTTVTVNPTNSLDGVTSYYVQIAATAIDDAAGNSYAGITNKTDLNFETASGPAASISINGPADVAAGETSGNFTINVLDAQGNETKVAQDTDFNLTSEEGGSTFNPTSPITISSGSSSATFTYSNSTVGDGNHTVTATWNSGGDDLGDATHDINLNTGAAATLAKTSGDGQTNKVATALDNPFVITITDAEGNPVNGESVSFEISSATQPGEGLNTTSTTTDANGEASSTLILGETVGTYEITVSSGSLGDVVFTATAIPGTADAATSLITAANGSITVNTGTTTITVQLRDQFENNLTTGGDAVVLSTSAGSLGGVTDEGDGTYTSTLSSSSTVETANITGTLGGDVITDDEDVDFVSGNATQFVFSGASSVTAGEVSGEITVTTQDGSGNTANVSQATVLNLTSNSAGNHTFYSDAGGTTTITQLTIANGNSSASFYYSDEKAAISTITGSQSSGDALGNNTWDIDVNHAALNQFVVSLSSPQSNAKTFTGTNTLTAQDEFENTIENFDASADNVTLSLNTLTGTLSGLGTGNDNVLNQNSDFVNGVADLTDLGLTYTGIVGTGTITGTAVSGSAGTSGNLTIEAGDATEMVFSKQPTQTEADAAITPTVEVQLQDVSGNDVAEEGVSIGIASNQGTLSGTTPQSTDANGVATFGDLSIAEANSGYRLTASSTGFDNVNSNLFSITVGGISTSVSSVSANPTTLVADGNTASTLTIVLKDANGNAISGEEDNITLSGLSNATTGTITESGTAGTYEVDLTNVTAEEITVTVSMDGTDLDDKPAITFEPGAISESNSSVTATSPHIADGTDASTVTIALKDANNNVIDGLTNADFSIALTGDASAGTVSETGTAGTYEVEVLSSTVETTTVTVTADGAELNDTPSITFQTGVASQLAFVGQPSASTPAGDNIGTITVQLEDVSGNLVENDGASITLAISDGATLVGTATQTTTNGVATFSNLYVEQPGTGYTLAAASGTLDTDQSTAFDITRLAITLTADAVLKTYGDDDPVFTYQVTGGSLITGVDLTGNLERAAGEDAGTYAITQGGLTNANNLSYDISFVSADQTIEPKDLTLSNFIADDKTYDGNVDVDGGGFDDDREAGDELAFDYDVAFADANAGTGKDVNFTNITISGGADAQNYNLVTTTGTATADISKAEPTITAWPTASGIIYGEILAQSTLSDGNADGTFAFTDNTIQPETVGTYAAEVTFTPTNATNYTATTQTVDVEVGKQELAISGSFTTENKVFDGTTDATIDENSLTVDTPVTGDEVSLSNVVIEFTSADVADDIEVSITSAELIGAQKDNYTLSMLDAPTTTADITNAGVSITTWPTATDIIYGEELSNSTLSGGTSDQSGSFTFTDNTITPDSVGTWEAEVTFTPDDNNYGSVTNNIDVKVLPKELTITDATASDKVYDGDTDAVITGATLNGVINSDDVTLNELGGTFADAYVGTVIEVSAAITLSGDDTDNYTLTQPSGLTADITAKELTISGSFNAQNKVYDGTADATINQNNLTLTTPVSGDKVSLINVVVAFVSADVADNTEVNITSAELSGAKAGNYTLSLTGAPTAMADITYGSLSASNSTVFADPDTLVADGVEESVITIELKDAGGNIINGQAENITLAGLNDAIPGTITETEVPGTYTVELTNTIAEAISVTVSLDGTEIDDKPGITFTPGSISAENSMVTASTPHVADGNDASEITITLRDANENLISGIAEEDFNLTFGDNATLLKFSEEGNGAYTFKLTNTVAEQVTLTVNVIGVELEQNPKIMFNTGAVSIDNSVASISDGKVGEKTPITIYVADATGNAVTGVASELAIVLSGANEGIEVSEIIDNKDGSYSASYIPESPGIDEFLITLSGDSISGNPYNSTVATSDLDALLIVSGNNQTQAVVTTLNDSLSVQVLDVNEFPIPGKEIQFEITQIPADADSQAIVFEQNNTNLDGLAWIKFKLGTKTGEYRISATVDTLAPVEFILKAIPGTVENYTIAGGSDQEQPTLSVLKDSLTVRIFDQYDNPVPNIAVAYNLFSSPDFSQGSELNPYTVYTNSSGIAASAFKLGDTGGTYKVSAKPLLDEMKAKAANESDSLIFEARAIDKRTNPAIMDTVNTVVFDGSENTYMYAKPSESLNNLKNFTLEIWVRPKSVEGQFNFFQKGTEEQSSQQFSMSVENNNLSATVYLDNGTQVTLNADDIFTENDALVGSQKALNNSVIYGWTHIAFVVDNENKHADLYKNGYRSDQSEFAGEVNTGEAQLEMGRGFNGEVHEVRVWEKAKTRNEVQSQLTQILTGTEESLILYHTFDDQGDKAEDLTNNGNDLLLENGVGRSFSVRGVPDIEMVENEQYIMAFKPQDEFGSKLFTIVERLPGNGKIYQVLNNGTEIGDEITIPETQLEDPLNRALYVPNENYNGLDSLQYSLEDSLGNSSVAKRMITIYPAYRPPTRFAQLLPAHNDSVQVAIRGSKQETTVNFNWEASSAFEDNDTEYILSIWDDTGKEQLFTQIIDTTFSVEMDKSILSYDKWFAWRVHSTDGIDTTISVAEMRFVVHRDVPMVYQLHQNYPNPFNPSTNIEYWVPVTSKVRIEIFDILGRKVQTLLDDSSVQTGTYRVTWKANGLASGTYFYRMVSEGVSGSRFVKIKKMMLIK